MMTELAEWIEAIVTSWVGGLETSGYWGIFLLMAIESSFIPFPSEIVMVPAGVLAAHGKLNLWGVILAGTAGSLAGAIFNYYFALFLGREFLVRFGKYFFVSHTAIERCDKAWEKYGEFSTFFCRLLPVVRQLISLPAGLTRMHFGKFCLWTTTGAGIWVTILTLCGYLFHEHAEQAWSRYKGPILLVTLVVLGVFLAGYVLRRSRQRRFVSDEQVDPN